MPKKTEWSSVSARVAKEDDDPQALSSVEVIHHDPVAPGYGNAAPIILLRQFRQISSKQYK